MHICTKGLCSITLLPEAHMQVIKTENLTKYYGKARGIIALDLSVQQGECFGFIGPNGAGKSTTIRTLLGLISPTSGTASVLGKSIITEKQDILRETGYLPSEAVFYSGMRHSHLPGSSSSGGRLWTMPRLWCLDSSS